MTAAVPPPSASEPKKPRRWRRRLLWILGIAIGFAVLLRIALAFALPSIVSAVASGRGLRAAYERLRLSILTGDVELWHLTLDPKEGGERYLHAEYCRIDLAMLPLLRGRAVFRRIELDGADVHLRRAEDGTIPFLDRLRGGAAEGREEPAPEARPRARREVPGKIDLSPPLEIDALRLQAARLHLRDEASDPPASARIDVDVELSDLGSKKRPARFFAKVHSAAFLDVFQAEGMASGSGNDLDVELSALLRGLRLERFAEQLRALGLRPTAGATAFEVKGKIATREVAEPGSEVSIALSVEGLEATAGGARFLALERLALEVPSAAPLAARASALVVRGGRLRLERTEEGNIRFGPVEILASGGGPRAAPKREPGRPPDRGAEPARAPPGEGLAAAIEKIEIEDVALEFSDRAIEPRRDLSLELKSLVVKDVVADPARPDEALAFEAKAACPGVFEELRVEGAAVPFAPRKTFEARVRSSGVAPRALDPYFAEAGLEPVLERGSLRLDLRGAVEVRPDGALAAEVAIEDIAYADGEELAAADAVRVSGVEVAPGGGATTIGAVEIVGPRLFARREASGEVRLLGLRTRPPTARGATGAAPPASAPEEPGPPPAIAIGRLVCREARLEFLDEAISPAHRIAVSDAGAELEGFRFGSAGPEGAKPATLRAWLAAPGLLEKLVAEGTLSADPTGGAVSLSVTGTGITAAAVAPYVSPAGAEPALAGGSLRARLDARVARAGGAMTGEFEISDVRWADGEERLLELDRFRLEGLEARPEKLRVASIAVEGPRAWLARDRGRRLRVAGFAVSPPRESPAPPPDDSVPPPPTARPRAPAPGTSAPTPAVEVDRCALSGLEVRWRDEAFEAPIETAVLAETEIQGLSTARGAPPATVRAAVRIPDIAEGLRASGELAADPDDAALRLDLAAEGLRGEKVSPYLPSGIRCSLRDGRARAKLEARLAAHPEGGKRAALVVSEVAYADGDSGPPFLALDLLRVLIERFDPEGGLVSIEECSVSGFEARAEKTAEGALAAMGFALEPSEEPESAGGGAGEAQEGQPSREVERPGKPAATEEPAAEGREAAPAARRLARKLPLITVKKLDGHLRRLAFRDASRPGAAEIALSDVRLRNPEPIGILGDDPTSQPPARLTLAGSLDPIVRSFGAELALSPFAAEPALSAEFSAEGIRGDGIAEIAPELAERIDGSALADGRFAARLGLTLSATRRGPAGFDLSREFGGAVEVKGVAFRNGPEGEVLAGFDALEVAGLRIDPKRGAVRIASVEIVKPRARLFRESDGLRALDILFKVPPGAGAEESAQAAEGAAKPAAPSPDAEPRATEAGARAGRGGGEFSIGKFLVSGIDVRIEDRSADPPTVVPLQDLEFDLRGISSRLFEEERPVRFSLYVESGKVPLREPLPGSLISGLFSDAAGVLTGAGAAERELEERPLFGDLTASGQLAFFPSLRGSVRLGLSAFELEGLRGSAAASGITLDSGMLDARLELDFEDGSLDAFLRAIFTDLVVSEPPDGPIVRYLHLPAPLQTVVFALRNERGELDVPIGIRLERGGVTAGAIAETAISTFGALVAQAIARAPLRAAGAVTNVASMGGIVPWKSLLPFGLGAAAPEPTPVPVSFEPGSTVPSAAELAALEPILRRIQSGEPLGLTLRHEFSARDLERAERIANPSRERCLDIISGVGRRKKEILVAREILAARARLAYETGSEGRAEEIRAEIARLDRELSYLEASFDRAYDLLRPGAERFAERRAREASLAIARERLDRVRDAIAEEFPDMRERLTAMRPQIEAAPDLELGRVVVVPQVQKAQ